MCFRQCCPNGCCGCSKPPVQIEKRNTTNVIVAKPTEIKKIPNGYVNFYAGVHTPDNKYTCPVLCVHLYHCSKRGAGVKKEINTIVSDKNNNQQQIHDSQQQISKEEKLTAEEEIIMIPVEDVMRIAANYGVKKDAQADIKTEVIPVYKTSENCCDRCCDAFSKCCKRLSSFKCQTNCCGSTAKVTNIVTNTINFGGERSQPSISVAEEHLPIPKQESGSCDSCRCWCCRKRKLIDLIKRTTTVALHEAERVVTITIEYTKYNHLDTPSNARLLSNEQQLKYYQEKFHPDTQMKFYLIHESQVDGKRFELKKKEAEVLCRTITVLKEMRGNYPSDTDLEKILNQEHKKTFGEVFNEPILLQPST